MIAMPLGCPRERSGVVASSKGQPVVASIKKRVTRREAAGVAGPPVTRDYRPSVAGMPAWSRESAFSFSLDAVAFMSRDETVALGTMMLETPVIRHEDQFVVEADDPRIAQLVTGIYRTIWKRSIRSILTHVRYGYSAAEALYDFDDQGKLRFTGLKPFYAKDVAPGRNLHTGDLGGVILRGGDTPRELLFAEGPRPAKGLWFYQGNEYNNWHGESRYVPAHPPWLDKTCIDGTNDIIRMWFYKNSYSGLVIRYPHRAERQEDGTWIHNQSIARQLAEALKAGGVAALPSTVNPRTGREEWSIDWPKMNGNPEGLLEYSRIQDGRILRGMRIPDDVVTGASSGFAGKKVSEDAFYTMEEDILHSVTSLIETEVVAPVVEYNYGPGHKYKTTWSPMLPARQQLDAQQQMGMAARGGGNPAVQGAQPLPQALVGGSPQMPPGGDPGQAQAPENRAAQVGLSLTTDEPLQFATPPEDPAKEEQPDPTPSAAPASQPTPQPAAKAPKTPKTPQASKSPKVKTSASDFVPPQRPGEYSEYRVERGPSGGWRVTYKNSALPTHRAISDVAHQTAEDAYHEATQHLMQNHKGFEGMQLWGTRTRKVANKMAGESHIYDPKTEKVYEIAHVQKAVEFDPAKGLDKGSAAWEKHHQTYFPTKLPPPAGRFKSPNWSIWQHHRNVKELDLARIPKDILPNEQLHDDELIYLTQFVQSHPQQTKMRTDALNALYAEASKRNLTIPPLPAPTATPAASKPKAQPAQPAQTKTHVPGSPPQPARGIGPQGADVLPPPQPSTQPKIPAQAKTPPPGGTPPGGTPPGGTPPGGTPPPGDGGKPAQPSQPPSWTLDEERAHQKAQRFLFHHGVSPWRQPPSDEKLQEADQLRQRRMDFISYKLEQDGGYEHLDAFKSLREKQKKGALNQSEAAKLQEIENHIEGEAKQRGYLPQEPHDRIPHDADRRHIIDVLRRRHEENPLDNKLNDHMIEALGLPFGFTYHRSEGAGERLEHIVTDKDGDAYRVTNSGRIYSRHAGEEFQPEDFDQGRLVNNPKRELYEKSTRGPLGPAEAQAVGQHIGAPAGFRYGGQEGRGHILVDKDGGKYLWQAHENHLVDTQTREVLPPTVFLNGQRQPNKVKEHLDRIRKVDELRQQHEKKPLSPKQQDEIIQLMGLPAGMTYQRSMGTGHQTRHIVTDKDGDAYSVDQGGTIRGLHNGQTHKPEDFHDGRLLDETHRKRYQAAASGPLSDEETQKLLRHVGAPEGATYKGRQGAEHVIQDRRGNEYRWNHQEQNWQTSRGQRWKSPAEQRLDNAEAAEALMEDHRHNLRKRGDGLNDNQHEELMRLLGAPGGLRYHETRGEGGARHHVLVDQDGEAYAINQTGKLSHLHDGTRYSTADFANGRLKDGKYRKIYHKALSQSLSEKESQAVLGRIGAPPGFTYRGRNADRSHVLADRDGITYTWNPHHGKLTASNGYDYLPDHFEGGRFKHYPEPKESLDSRLDRHYGQKVTIDSGMAGGGKATQGTRGDYAQARSLAGQHRDAWLEHESKQTGVPKALLQRQSDLEHKLFVTKNITETEKDELLWHHDMAENYKHAYQQSRQVLQNTQLTPEEHTQATKTANSLSEKLKAKGLSWGKLIFIAGMAYLLLRKRGGGGGGIMHTVLAGLFLHYLLGNKKDAKAEDMFVPPNMRPQMQQEAEDLVQQVSKASGGKQQPPGGGAGSSPPPSGGPKSPGPQPSGGAKDNEPPGSARKVKVKAFDPQREGKGLTPEERDELWDLMNDPQTKTDAEKRERAIHLTKYRNKADTAALMQRSVPLGSAPAPSASAPAGQTPPALSKDDVAKNTHKERLGKGLTEEEREELWSLSRDENARKDPKKPPRILQLLRYQNDADRAFFQQKHASAPQP